MENNTWRAEYFNVQAHCVIIVFGAVSGLWCGFADPGEALLAPPLSVGDDYTCCYFISDPGWPSALFCVEWPLWQNLWLWPFKQQKYPGVSTRQWTVIFRNPFPKHLWLSRDAHNKYLHYLKSYKHRIEMSAQGSHHSAFDYVSPNEKWMNVQLIMNVLMFLM